MISAMEKNRVRKRTVGRMWGRGVITDLKMKNKTLKLMTNKQDTQHSTERLITFYQNLKRVYYTKHHKQTNEND